MKFGTLWAIARGMQQEVTSHISTYPNQVVCQLLEECEKRLHRIESMCGLEGYIQDCEHTAENRDRYHEHPTICY